MKPVKNRNAKKVATDQKLRTSIVGNPTGKKESEKNVNPRDRFLWNGPDEIEIISDGS